MIENYWKYDGLALADLVKRKEVTSAELLESAIEAAAKLNPELNFMCHDLSEMARRYISDIPGDAPFAGVPFLLKDLGAQMKDTPYEGGCRLLKGFVSKFDSNLTTRFKQAGLNTFAKTTTPELGTQVMTETILTGITRNPWNLEHTPGGSSGGAAAAVAAGVVPIAHANDGLGSIRAPAANCGLFGMKPTRQRTPAGPNAAELSGGRGIEFVVSRTVRDSAVLLDAVHGADVGAPHWAPPPTRPYIEELSCSRKNLKIALMTKTFTGENVDESCSHAAADTASMCEQLGHHVEEAKPEIDFPEYHKAVKLAATASMTAGLRAIAEGVGREPSPDNIESLTWLSYLRGKEISAFEYFKAIEVYGKLQRSMGEFFTAYDILITPMFSKPTARIGWLGQPDDDLDRWWEKIAGDGYCPFYGVFNVTGQPAASIPLHQDNNGLPVGTQLVGGFGDEGTIFSLAAELEQLNPWIDRLPPCHVSSA